MRVPVDLGMTMMTLLTIIEESTFDDFPNPRAFNDWLANLEYYFDLYKISEERTVRFARMRLMGSARTYETSVKRERERERERERDCMRCKIFI